MKIWVGVTDKSWFERLVALMPDEVNLWQPSGSRAFKVLRPGETLLFKLHSPDNFIAGGRLFVRYSPLAISLALDTFQQKNGVSSLEQLRARVYRYTCKTRIPDPVIGCIPLPEPFLFQRADLIQMPASGAPDIVQGKTYDTDGLSGPSYCGGAGRGSLARHNESMFKS